MRRYKETIVKIEERREELIGVSCDKCGEEIPNNYLRDHRYRDFVCEDPDGTISFDLCLKCWDELKSKFKYSPVENLDCGRGPG